jgi:hypothetical protein
MIDINKKIRDEIRKCKYAGVIYLSHCRLHDVPSKLLSASLDIQACLRRLDLSNNDIKMIPSGISEFSELRELWLQNNPIVTLPPQIELCTKLEIIDLKYTLVNELPSELSNIKGLYDLDYRETPFEQYIIKHYDIKATGSTGLALVKRIFKDKYERQCLKAAIVEKLIGELYVKESDDPQTLGIVENMVEVRIWSYKSSSLFVMIFLES